MIAREPLNILHDRERPYKRQKPGVAMEVASLQEVGAINYSIADYRSAELCFTQALRQVDGDYLFSQATSCFESVAESHQRRERNSIEYDEGMRAYKNVIQIQSTFSDSEVAASLFYNVAQTYVERGLYTVAMKWFYKSHDRFFVTREHQNSLHIVMNLHCLGYCSYRLGDEEKARDFYDRAFAIASNCNLGPIHMAASMNCVGVIRFNQHQSFNPDLATDLFTNSLALYRSYDKNNAISIATVLNNLGRTHYLRSEFEKAIKIYEECLQLRRSCLGKQSNDVAATTYNLGQTCYQIRHLDHALVYYLEFVEISTAINSPPSKENSLAYKCIAEIYQEKSDLKPALQYFQKSLEIQRECAQGRPDTEVAAMLNKMGSLCYEMKDFFSAVTHYQEGLEIEQIIHEPNHQHIIITTTNIGHVYKQLRHHKKALSAYNKVYHMQREKFGKNSFVLAETLSSMGLMQYHMRNYQSSFDYYQEALRIRRLEFESDDHPEIASTLNSIGLVLFKQEIFGLAKDCFQESLRIRSKIFGKDHRDVAILWYNIATIHFETGEEQLSIQMFKETLRVERHALGNDHPDVVQTLQHLGQVHQNLGYTEEAIDYFQEALDIERRRKLPERRSLVRVLNLLGNSYLQLGRTSDMMSCYGEAARLYESDRTSCETLLIGGYNFYGLSKTNPPCAPSA